jgi:hypothetical protein
MASKENVFVNVVTEFNGKALTKGQKQLASFEKNLKSLARAFGVTFGAAAIVKFSKATINAFMADEKAAKSLEMQLKNTGYAFSAPDVEYYIANLQKMYGVLDDQLRPAFQTLLTASGSITKSQRALATALNVSAATGKSVEEVSAAMAKGFSGQTTALSRLGAGLDKTTIASGDMNKILDELDTKFSGQALARLETYAGKMDQLKVATADASEIIGKDLLDSLSAFSKDDSLSGFSDLLSGIATKLAGLDKAVFGFAARLAGIKKQTVNFTYSLGAGAGVEIAKAKEAALLKKTNAARAAELAALNKKNSVDKLKDQFDLERIGLMAALNAATDDETKLRLKAQLAILDNNEALAKKLLAEMNATKAIETFTDSTQKASAGLATAFDALSQAAKNLMLSFGLSPSQVGAGGTNKAIAGFPDISGLATTSLNNPNFGTSAEAAALGLALGFTPMGSSLGMSTGSSAPANITVNVDATNMVDPANMTKVVQESLLIISKNGYSTVPAGQGF